MGRILLGLSSLWLIVGLVGCALSPSAHQSSPYEKKLYGRFVIEFTKDQQRHREQGKFLWGYGPEHKKLEIFSIFGQTHARLEIMGNQSALYMVGQPPRYADNPETLMQALLGFSVPVQVFSEWLNGQPSTSYPQQITRDHQGNIISIEQLGWTIVYRPYAAAIPPRQINLYHAKTGLQLRLMIDTENA